MFFEQFSKLCLANNTTPTRFTIDILKLSSSNVTAWKNGSIPKYKTLKTIADHFNVTVGFLFDGESALPAGLTADERRIVDIYRKLTECNKSRLEERGLIFIEQQNSVCK